MPLPGRRLLGALAAAVGLLGAVAAPAPATARTAMMQQPKYAAIVVDANTGEVLYERRADAQRFPASITKVMTAYLTFEALATGRLKMDDRVPFSRWAADQAPSKLGVPMGGSLSVRQAILGLTVKSANDAAVALAERVGGTEARFAQLMTLRAQELGMTSTRYFNANGLPDGRHQDVNVSTARDIAVLSRAIIRDYPQYYYFFDQADMSWNGHEVLNPHSFLKKIPGVDGIKTGYTNAAGHNLAASAVRGGRRLITVVLGGSSSAARDENVADLMDAGFSVMGSRAGGGKLTVAALLHDPDEAAGPLTRPLQEMGSAHDPEVRFVQAPAQVRPPGRTVAATMRPVRLAAALPAADPDCRRMRGRKLRSCRAQARSFARGTETAAVDCGSRRARRRHRAACEAVVAAPAVAARDCGHLHGRRARACRAETATAVAATTPDCSSRRARRSRACRAQAAAAAPSTCAGKHGSKARACRARERDVAKADHGRHGRGAKLVAASAEAHRGRRRHAAVAEAGTRAAKASLKTAKAACRGGRHAKRCRAADEDA